MADSDPRRLVVGVSGASGAAYGVRVLDACRDLGVESHLVASRAAALTLKQETGLTLADLAGRRFDVVKVPHHGSRAQDPALVSAARAPVALVSVGAGNPYGHPAAATIAGVKRYL